MRDDDTERLGSLYLFRDAEAEVLDPVAGIVAGNFALRAFEGVQALVDGAVADAVDRHLEPVRGRVEDEVIDLFLPVVGLARRLGGAVLVADRHRRAGPDGVP